MRSPTLLIISSLSSQRRSDGRILTSAKFISGVLEYQKFWPGVVNVIVPSGEVDGSNLDYLLVSPEDLPFQMSVNDFRSVEVRDAIKQADIVSLMLYQGHMGVAAICRSERIPHVFTSEYSLATRMQITATESTSPLRRSLKAGLEAFREVRNRRAISSATGVQCNGTPTFDAYQAISPNPMLFFDTRTRDEQVATVDDLANRFAGQEASKRLRLAFSGRLIPMKGADHLIMVAAELHALGVEFDLTICGDGSLHESMRKQVANLGLTNKVDFAGVLDFTDELLPFMREQVDIFLCCHRQGDPSCTYLETMACGVPIAGYANAAFSGIARLSSCGWPSTMDDPKALARLLANLSTDEIRAHSHASLAFARERSFEKEFARRMQHLCGAVQL